MALDPEQQKEEEQIHLWKTKRLLKELENARGNGTSVISLIMPAGSQLHLFSQMLVEEEGKASNIKNPSNRGSVQEAIRSAIHCLKMIGRMPPNGLAVYCGTVVGEDGKERKTTRIIEPLKPLHAKLYLCDRKFHLQPLHDLLESHDRFGFIVVDGNGCLFGSVAGNHREVLHKFMVELPKKHGRGGQSALRFARLRDEARHNYLRKCAELATQVFITNDRPNVAGLIVAGSADFKTELAGSDLFDQRLGVIVLKIVDVAYGGENGFSQAIELAADTLGDVKFVQEKRLIEKYFSEIARDGGKVVYGVEDTLTALQCGAVETLIVWENLDTQRVSVQKPGVPDPVIMHLSKEKSEDMNSYRDEETGATFDVLEKIPLVEWLADNYKKMGCKMELVTNRSPEGAQFCKGFGGMGGLLRYQLDVAAINDEGLPDTDSDESSSEEGGI